MNKKNDYFVTPKNTPHLVEKTIIIGLSLFYSGLNVLVSINCCFIHLTVHVDDVKVCEIIGIILIVASVINVLDSRKAHRGTFACVINCSIHLGVSTILAYYSSALWFIIWAFENTTIAGVVLLYLWYYRKCFNHKNR